MIQGVITGWIFHVETPSPSHSDQNTKLMSGLYSFLAVFARSAFALFLSRAADKISKYGVRQTKMNKRPTNM